MTDQELIDHATEVHNVLHGWKEGFAAATGKEEPYALLQACCVISDYIKLLKSTRYNEKETE